MDLYLNMQKVGQTRIYPDNTLKQIKDSFKKWASDNDLGEIEIKIVFNNEEELNPIVFQSDRYDKATFRDKKHILRGGKIFIKQIKSFNKFDIDILPLPALQEILLKLHRSELNVLCNESKKVKKICDEHNFREIYKKLHPIYTEEEIKEHAKEWIREIYGETNFADVKNLTLQDLIDILQMIEDKTVDNKEKIVFYGEEQFSSKFAERASELETGFVAHSMFAGILGSFIVEIFLEPQRWIKFVQFFKDMLEDENKKLNIENFIVFIVENYEAYSSIFNLNDVFTGEIMRRIVDKKGLRYERKKVKATLQDVDVWNIDRLKNTPMPK